MAFHTWNFSFEGIAGSGCLYSFVHVFVKTSGLKNTPSCVFAVEWSYNDLHGNANYYVGLLNL